MVGSIYMSTGEGWSARNVNLMQAVWAKMSELATYWLVGGDMNMEPKVFRRGYWVQPLDTLLVVPDEATHEQGSFWPTLSYFFAHPGL